MSLIGAIQFGMSLRDKVARNNKYNEIFFNIEGHH